MTLRSHFGRIKIACAIFQLKGDNKKGGQSCTDYRKREQRDLSTKRGFSYEFYYSSVRAVRGDLLLHRKSCKSA